MVRFVAAKNVSKYLAEIGFSGTSKWVEFSLKNKASDFGVDMVDILNTFRIEFRAYRQEYYRDLELKQDCYKEVLVAIIGALTADAEKFYRLSAESTPLIERIANTSKDIETLMKDSAGLEPAERFYQTCAYYQMLWAGDFEAVRKNLLFMKKITEAKAETPKTQTTTPNNNESESSASLDRVMPSCLKTGEHDHLGNVIANSNFKYLESEGKMEFWDTDPKTQTQNWEPRKYSLKEFQKTLLKINLFCETYALLMMLFIALESISKTRISTHT